MAISKAQQKAVRKYEAANYDFISVRCRKDSADGYPTRDEINAAAAASGMTLSIFIKEAIREKMDRMSRKA